MPVNYTYKTIFIHIPKCAGTSIESILQIKNEVNFYTEIFKFSNIPLSNNFTDSEYRICASKNKQHYTYKELSRILPKNILENFNKFAVVRNPYDRLVSEYYYCKSYIKEFKNFEDFVLKTLSLDVYTRNWLHDGHLETQTSFLLNDNNNFSSLNKIFKYENLNECFEYLAGITGKKMRPHFRKSIDRGEWQNYYTPELKNIVYNFYKEDFINFNYGIN